MSPSTTMTADELLRSPIPDQRVELVCGVLVVREPAGYLHGEITARLAKLLMDHVAARRLGRILAAETGFKLRAPLVHRSAIRTRRHSPSVTARPRPARTARS
jgi:Uma2 family endonuclease